MPISQPKAGAVIYVKNLISVSKFYGEVAGLDKTHVESDHVVLESATLQLVILSIPKDIAALITIATPPARRTEAPIKLVFSVPDLAASRETVAKFGGELNPPEREWYVMGMIPKVTYFSCEQMQANQSSEPTLSSGTSPAGQEPRLP